MVGVIYVRVTFVPTERSLEGNLYSVLVVALGATIFSIVFFGVITHREEELRQSNKQIEALHEAALALTTELDLQIVLQKVVNLSRDLLNAKYGALGVINPESNLILQFITAGISKEERALIGSPPKGRGLLGIMSPGGHALIVNDISKDERAVGFPPNHPVMHSLLGVPIKSKGEIFGNLYVADKLDPNVIEADFHTIFDESDRQLLEKFATQAAIAIENAQLYRKTQELAILQERERFGMALHDGIMQSVYATGLSLQEAQSRITKEPQEAEKRIGQSIQDLGQVLRDLRNYIMGLRTGRYQGQDLATTLSQMAEEFHVNTLTNVIFEAPPNTPVLGLNEEQTDELVHIVQEVLSNIRKHATAGNVTLTLNRKGNRVLLSIKDDGIGFDMENAANGGGYGLRNMRERAETLGADIKFWSEIGRGTQISLDIPVAVVKEKSF